MRAPFNAPVDFFNADHRSGNELTRTNVTLSGRDYCLQNGDAKPFAPNSDTSVRHQLQGASLHNDLIAEDPNTCLMDLETKELYFRSRTQEEEILLLRKQIADASLKELQLLGEKHILERKLSDLRMAVDEKQEDAISGALKQLSQKKNHVEENMRLANELKVEEEELYLFTSSLLGILAEYNVRPPQINASTITTGTKRLYQQMQWKIRSLNMAKCNFTRWIDPPHERHVVRYVDVLWNRIFDLEAQIDDLKEQNDDLRQQMQRERGNEEVVNIGSSYDPTCCCVNPSCICACHYNDDQPRPRRPTGEHSMWVARGTFYN